MSDWARLARLGNAGGIVRYFTIVPRKDFLQRNTACRRQCAGSLLTNPAPADASHVADVSHRPMVAADHLHDLGGRYSLKRAGDCFSSHGFSRSR